MAITVRSAASGTSGTSAVASIATTLPTGATTGDLVFVFGYNINTAAGTWSQSAGTGTFTFHSTNDSNTAGGGCQSFAAWRIFTGTETAPTFAFATGGSGRMEWAAVAVTPDVGSTISIDTWATTLVDTNTVTTHTPNSATAAGTGEVSVLGNCVVRSAKGSSGLTWTDSSGWTIPTSGTANQAGNVSNFSGYIDVATKTGVSSTVSPGVETSGSNLAVVANIYHVLVTQTANVAAFIPAGPLIAGQAVKRAGYW